MCVGSRMQKYGFQMHQWCGSVLLCLTIIKASSRHYDYAMKMEQLVQNYISNSDLTFVILFYVVGRYVHAYIHMVHKIYILYSNRIEK